MANRSKGAEFWREQFQLMKQSGKSMKKHCEENGLTYSTCQLWKKRLKREDSSFQQLEVARPDIYNVPSSECAEVLFPSGAHLRFHSLSDSTLRSLVRELLQR
jgi:hypothetical protein